MNARTHAHTQTCPQMHACTFRFTGLHVHLRMPMHTSSPIGCHHVLFFFFTFFLFSFFFFLFSFFFCQKAEEEERRRLEEEAR